MSLLENLGITDKYQGELYTGYDVYTDIDDVPFDTTPVADGDDSLLAATNGVGLPKDRTPLSVSMSKTLLPKRVIVPYKRQLKKGMKGGDVIAVKRALKRAKVRKIREAGPRFGSRLQKDLKKFQQSHGLKVDGVYGDNTHKKLAPYFDAYGIWLLQHGPKAPAQLSKRETIVATAIFGYNNRYSIHYTQSGARMYGVRNHVRPPRIPYYEDCSSFATWCYWVAGAPDPNGLFYSGYGFTGTLAMHGRRVSPPQPADLNLYGWRAPYVHVTISISSTRCISHGGEAGPLLLPIHYRSDFNHTRSYL